MLENRHMSLRQFRFGDHLPGLLVDGIDGTPYVGAVLRLDQRTGLTVEIPYLHQPDVEQFGHVQAWFEEQSPPTNMVFLSAEGSVSLFDVAWLSHSQTWGGNKSAVGNVRPDVAVFDHGRGPLQDPLVMRELQSRIDGLNEWSCLSAVTRQHERDESGRLQALTLRVAAQDGFTWQQGGATMSVRTGWSSSRSVDQDVRGIIVEDNVQLTSRFEGEEPFWDHFVEHRKVANLLVLLYGNQLAFREHWLRGSRFDRTLPDGTVDQPLNPVISNRTVRERLMAVPTSKGLGRPVAFMGQLGADGLTHWAQNYEQWKRFIIPAVNALGRDKRVVEDVVISTSLGLEAAGRLLGRRAGEQATYTKNGRTTVATDIFRCLDTLNLQWPKAAGNKVSLARAISSTYNTIKHFDRGDFPALEQSHIISMVNTVLVQLLAVHLTGRGDSLLEPWRRGENFDSIASLFEGYRLSLASDGTWLSQSSRTPLSFSTPPPTQDKQSRPHSADSGS